MYLMRLIMEFSLLKINLSFLIEVLYYLQRSYLRVVSGASVSKLLLNYLNVHSYILLFRHTVIVTVLINALLTRISGLIQAVVKHLVVVNRYL